MLAAQILAVIIFITMFILVVLDKIERQYVTLGCGLATLIGVFGIAMRSLDAILLTLNLKVFLPLNSGMRQVVQENLLVESTGLQLFLLQA